MTYATEAKAATFVPVQMTDGTFGFMAEDEDRPGVVGYGPTEDEALESLDRARAAYDRLRQNHSPSGSLGSGELEYAGWRIENGRTDLAATF